RIGWPEGCAGVGYVPGPRILVRAQPATAKPLAATLTAVSPLRHRIVPPVRSQSSAPWLQWCRTGVEASHHGRRSTTAAPPCCGRATDPGEPRLEHTS